MAVTEIGDPRLQALFGQDSGPSESILPTVRPPRRGLSGPALGAIAVAFAILLFVILNGRRASLEEPVEETSLAPASTPGWAPPPLYMPPAPSVVTQPVVELDRPITIAPAITPQPQMASPQIIYQPQPTFEPQQLAPPPPPARTSAGSPLVIDTGSASAEAVPKGASAGLQGFPGASTSRARASNFANKSTTVPQGYLIPAVLESGFNSSEPGFARAIVSRDVRGFDGKNVLIPRGSRLIGEYRSNVAQGQRRAAILWTRLIRPDGRTISLDSPAVDTIGRGGVSASVNTHFFERLGDALLQSTIGIGTAIAGRAATGPVVVVPQTANTAAQLMPARNWVPTLTVPAGKSISVYVAQDLDFGTEASRQ